MKRAGLGRGLDVLLPQNDNIFETVVRDIPIEDIDPNMGQPRKEFDEDALKQLAWSSEELAVLEAQQAWGRGFPEIAGGYSTTRHMTNAIRKVINNKEDPRETLLTYTHTINEEIEIKRKEFGLPLDGEEAAK